MPNYLGVLIKDNEGYNNIAKVQINLEKDALSQNIS
jgi:hypothetical protein